MQVQQTYAIYVLYLTVLATGLFLAADVQHTDQVRTHVSRGAQK